MYLGVEGLEGDGMVGRGITGICGISGVCESDRVVGAEVVLPAALFVVEK